MVRSRREKPIELVAFARSGAQTFNDWPCDGVTAHNVGSFADLLALHARLQAELSGVRILATLDDLDQACYTSAHAVDAHELDSRGDSEGEEVDDDGFVAPDFESRLANLTALSREFGLNQIAGVLPWATSEEADDLISVNRDPEAALQIAREAEIIFQYVPAASACDTIAAFPNGYFRADLNPMQNHLLARHLEQEYGLDLVAIGSRFLAFRRRGPLDEFTARRLSTELTALYAGTPAGAAAELADLITGDTSLVVRYTGN